MRQPAAALLGNKNVTNSLSLISQLPFALSAESERGEHAFPRLSEGTDRSVLRGGVPRFADFPLRHIEAARDFVEAVLFRGRAVKDGQTRGYGAPG